MKKANSSSRNTKAKPSKGQPRKKMPKSQNTEKGAQNSRESEILKMWATKNVYAVNDKMSAQATCVIREMPTPVHSLSVDTLRRKIYQDVFLKYEMMLGNTVVYSPLWETFPFNIEAIVIKEKAPSSSRNIVNFRKQCRQIFSEQLKTQQQKIQKLGIFADWTSSEKTLEPRYETKLFSHFDRLREYKFLHDELRLSHWCPNCVSPLESGKTVTKISTNALHTYVKFPFSIGFEEFGKDVFFAVHLPESQLWEVAGTIALGICKNVTYWLTQFENEYIIFAEPQLKKFVGPKAESTNRPEPVAKLKASQLKDYSVVHPLFSLSDLPFFIIPEKIIRSISDSSEKKELNTGIIPLNPAHHPLSYAIVNALPLVDQSLYDKFVSSTSTTPIFDETGRFTEDADTLCGLNLAQAAQFIIDELETRECLIKARKEKTQQLQCQHCNGLSVSRPYRHWFFSLGSSGIKEEVTNSHEYWEHYDDDIREPILSQVVNVTELPVSSERQWGIPFPVMRCDNCNDLISDKKILRSVRSSIRRGSEHWFRLSVEELLPTDTVCISCHSRDFRKESTYIESHFSNLLQTLDSSDFKKPTIEAASSVAFAPRADFFQWLGELSVLSASLQQSRPTKESQPFKNLKYNPIPEKVWETEIQDKTFQKYPADVFRIVALAPDLYQTEIEGDGTEQLETLIKKYNRKYTQLKDVFYQALELQADHQKKRKTKRCKTKSNEFDEKMLETLQPTDTLAVSLTSELLDEIEEAYKKRDFYKMWELLSDFCRTDFTFYINFCRTEISEEELESVQIALPIIFKVLVQRLAPLMPFLAEEIYAESVSASASIFEEKWNYLSPINSDTEIRTEWESLKNVYKSKTKNQ